MAIIALFMICIVSWIIVQSGATALMMTGLSRGVAEFQAISCFFGVGFTTHEAEQIVNHPVRRRIASHLIVVGNIGLTSALGTLIVTFVDAEPDLLDRWFHIDDALSFPARLTITVSGLAVIVGVFRLGIVKRPLEWIIKWTLERVHAVEAVDYDTVLRSSEGYTVAQVEVEEGAWYVGQTLAQAMLGTKGVLILSISRDDEEEIGTPHPTTDIRIGDVLTVYGHEDAIRSVLGRERPVDRGS